MNCKQGDLAIMVRSMAGNEGVIVRCLRLATSAECENLHRNGGAWWFTDRTLVTNFGEKTRCACDAWLRPIRDPGEDATDETLTWIPVPHKETA